MNTQRRKTLRIPVLSKTLKRNWLVKSLNEKTVIDQFNYEDVFCSSRRYNDFHKYNIKSIRKGQNIHERVHWNGISATDKQQQLSSTSSLMVFISTMTQSQFRIHYIRNFRISCPHSTRKKATGRDGLGNTVLKNLSSSLGKSLCLIFWAIVNTGDFPTCLKISIIVPIHKEVMSKVIGLLVFFAPSQKCSRKSSSVLFTYMCKISPTQHGFSKRKSVITQMLEFLYAFYEHFVSPQYKELYVLCLTYRKRSTQYYTVFFWETKTTIE